MIQLSTHVKHPHEYLDMSIVELKRLVFDVLFNGITATEKLDGQNFTFFVDDYLRVRFVGKGAIKWIKSQGGFSRSDLLEHYKTKPAIAQSFVNAYDAAQQLVDQHPALFKALRKNDSHISCEILCANSRNIVKYDKDVMFILGTLENNDIDDVLKLLPFNASNGLTIKSVPVAKFIRDEKAIENINEIVNGLDQLMQQFSLTNKATILDLCVEITKSSLKKVLPGDVCHKAALRLITQEKNHLKRSDFSHPISWKTFQDIEKHRSAHMQELLFPFINIIMKLGVFANSSYKAQYASDDDADTKATIDNVDAIIAATNSGLVEGDRAVMSRLKSDVAMIGELHKSFKNVEGIVFESGGRTMKLVGLYSIVNRICGYFKFGESPLRIIKKAKE